MGLRLVHVSADDIKLRTKGRLILPRRRQLSGRKPVYISAESGVSLTIYVAIAGGDSRAEGPRTHMPKSRLHRSRRSQPSGRRPVFIVAKGGV